MTRRAYGSAGSQDTHVMKSGQVKTAVTKGLAEDAFLDPWSSRNIARSVRVTDPMIREWKMVGSCSEMGMLTCVVVWVTTQQDRTNVGLSTV